MNRGDEADSPFTEGDPLAPAAPAGPGRPGASGQGSESSSHFAVVIFDDGSAAIDGESVPIVPGEPLDVAILDMLHGFARSRNAPITGAISDPSADYVAIVEVAPDGSSKLLEQVEKDTEAAAGGIVETTVPVERSRHTEPDEALGPGPAPAGSSDSERTDDTPAPSKPSALGPVPAVDNTRRKAVPQSDDEYERPGLFQRPLVVGGVAAVVSVAVIGSLVALGTGSGNAGEKNEAAGSGSKPSESSMTFRQPSPSASESLLPTLPASPSPSKSPSKKPSKSPSKKPTTPPKPDPPKPKPLVTKVPPSDPGLPRGPVVIKNLKWGYCVDLPGQGKGSSGAGIFDEQSCTKSPKDNQLWEFKLTAKGKGTGGSDLYLIRNVKDGLCMDLPGMGPARIEQRIVEYKCIPDVKDNQLWWLDKRPNGTYWIRNQKSGDMCIDVARKDRKAANTRLRVYVCNDADDHQWRFVKG
ncbi:RICIN domain-containing protein [Streptomyces sp. NPDC006288]|uniref:RICIN domain-containing protein n=1 Tax=Streptomyces sp. NPDC006288 TaxID=3156743 RepID=UPI0033B36537